MPDNRNVKIRRSWLISYSAEFSVSPARTPGAILHGAHVPGSVEVGDIAYLATYSELAPIRTLVGWCVIQDVEDAISISAGRRARLELLGVPKPAVELVDIPNELLHTMWGLAGDVGDGWAFREEELTNPECVLFDELIQRHNASPPDREGRSIED